MYKQWLIQAGFIWMGILWSFCSYGQLGPLGAMPMQFVSSFAGEAGLPRISSSFSYESNNYSYKRNHFYHSYLSYDQFMPFISSGVGITAGWKHFIVPGFSYNVSPPTSNIVNEYFLSGVIAPKFSIKGKYTFSPSLDFTYKVNPTPESFYIIGRGQFYTLQSRVGLLFNTKKLYLGFSAYILDATTFKDTINFNYKQRGYLQLGYTFQRNSESKFSFTPQIVWGMSDSDYHHNHIIIDAITLNFRYKHLLAGVNNLDNLGFHVGWQTDKLRVMASTSFGNESFLGNLSFRYLFKNQEGNHPTSLY